MLQHVVTEMSLLLASRLQGPVLSYLRAPLAAPLLAPQSRGAKVKAGAPAGGAKGKGGKGGVMQKVVLEVETDAHKLVSEVCGANYVLGSDPILIKVSNRPQWVQYSDVQEDSEYSTGQYSTVPVPV